MIKFYFKSAPNPNKVALFLEEAGLPYEVIPIDTRTGDQHTPEFRAINPNRKVPAIIDTNGPAGPTRVFDSSAILLYLGEKTGKFMGAPEDKGDLLSWLMFIGTGLGPFSGQAGHFQRAAPETIPYAIKRYRNEAARHYRVLDAQLSEHEWIVGDGYSIVDMSAWGWVDRAPDVFLGDDDPLGAFPNVKRWFQAVDARPAAKRARLVGSAYSFKTELDEVARRALFPSNYATEG